MAQIFLLFIAVIFIPIVSSGSDYRNALVGMRREFADEFEANVADVS
jgi:hypothetical protein